MVGQLWTPAIEWTSRMMNKDDCSLFLCMHIRLNRAVCHCLDISVQQRPWWTKPDEASLYAGGALYIRGDIFFVQNYDFASFFCFHIANEAPTEFEFSNARWPAALRYGNTREMDWINNERE